MPLKGIICIGSNLDRSVRWIERGDTNADMDFAGSIRYLDSLPWSAALEGCWPLRLYQAALKALVQRRHYRELAVGRMGKEEAWCFRIIWGAAMEVATSLPCVIQPFSARSCLFTKPGIPSRSARLNVHVSSLLMQIRFRHSTSRLACRHLSSLRPWRFA